MWDPSLLSISQWEFHWVLWWRDPISLAVNLNYGTTLFFLENHPAVDKLAAHTLLSFYQLCCSARPLRPNHKSAEQIIWDKRRIFESTALRPARQTQQALSTFDVYLLESMPSHWRLNLPLFEAWEATLWVQRHIQPLYFTDCTQLPSQGNCTPTIFTLEQQNSFLVIYICLYQDMCHTAGWFANSHLLSNPNCDQ